MIRHILLFSFRDEVDQTDRQAMLNALRRLPDIFPAMRDFQLGRNESSRDATYEYGMTVSFDTLDELAAYLDSESHERFVAERFRPLVSRRTIVSFEVQPSTQAQPDHGG